MRGIAAWAVVLYHVRSAPAGLPDGVQAVLAKGYLAVDFFFLLSGFVIWMSWNARLRDRGLVEIPEFLKRRLARIWPLHVAMLGFGAALATLLAMTGRADPATFPPAELPLHLLLVQNWGFTPDLTWNDPAWSISCELGAYLLFPLLTLAIDWRRVPPWAVLAAVGALFVLLHAVFASAGARSLGDDIPRLGLIRCVLEFAAGGAIGALWLRWRDTPAPAALTALAVATAALTSLPETLAVPAGFGSLLLALALSSGVRGNPLDAGWLHTLGEASYATYLSHYLLWFAFKLALVDDAAAVPWPLIALYLVGVLLASFALRHLVERPAQRWLNAVGTLRDPHALVGHAGKQDRLFR
jgi:peptidoglycan/LPS O-acetylase OafA/YrhL